MGCGMSMVKYILFLFNLLCAICAILIIVGGSLLAASVKHEGSSDSSLMVLPISIIVLGSVILMIAFFGCCGAIRESYCMSMTYSVMMFILLILQIVTIAFTFVGKDELLKEVDKQMDRQWEDVLKNGKSTTVWDALQKDNQCCGKTSVNDFEQLNGIPESCCEENTGACTQNNAFKIGCKTVIHDAVGKGLDVSKYGLLVIGLVELTTIVFGCCLANHIRNDRRRGAY